MFDARTIRAPGGRRMFAGLGDAGQTAAESAVAAWSTALATAQANGDLQGAANAQAGLSAAQAAFASAGGSSTPWGTIALAAGLLWLAWRAL